MPQRKMLHNIFLIQFLILFQLSIYFEKGNCQKEVLNLTSFGEYYLYWKYVGPCESSKNTNQIQMNVKLTKKNKRPQIFGNYTFLIPWDESISMHLHYMRMNLGANFNSPWITNTNLWTFTGCNQYRSLLAGNGFLRHMNLPDKCPMPKGVYVMREYDVDKIIEDAGPLIPKSFFYGSYKVVCDIKKNERAVGCARIAIDFIPKWQRRNKTR